MGRFWKVLVAGMIVLGMVIALSLIPNKEKSGRNPTMIEAKWNLAGLDRDGNRILPNEDIEPANRFEISFDTWSTLAYVSNPTNNTVMRYDENGNFIFNEHISTTLQYEKCSPVTWNKLNGYTKKNKFVDLDYITDTINRNVFEPNDSFRLANPKEATLIEPVQTAVFEDAISWREYVIDRAGNKLMSFAHADGNEKCDRYSKVLWSIPKGFEMSNAQIGEDSYSFSGPSSVCVDGAGNVYVADTGNNRIMKYNPNGEFQDEFRADLDKPKAVTVNADGSKIYICDSGNKKVVVLDALSRTTNLVIANDKFIQPNAICLDHSGDIWVGDSVSSTLFKFLGLGKEDAGKLAFAVDEVLTRRKYPKTVLEVEITKYSARRNGDAVRIRPFAQSVKGIGMVPIKFVYENLLKDESRGKLEDYKFEYDPKTKEMCILIPGFDINDTEKYEERLVEFKVGSDKAKVNGKVVKLAACTMIDGSVCLPFTDLEMLFGVEVKVKEPKTEPISKNPVYTLVFPPVKR
jgi:DNA-binding beta-propeller fold protein YncE